MNNITDDTKNEEEMMKFMEFMSVVRIIPDEQACEEMKDLIVWHNTLRHILANGKYGSKMEMTSNEPLSIKRLARRLLFCNFMFHNKKQVGVTCNNENSQVWFLILKNGNVELTELTLCFNVKNADKKFRKVKEQCDTYAKTIDKVQQAIESGEPIEPCLHSD